MSIIDTILENEDFQNHLKENENVIAEAEQMVDDFSKVLKSFVISHPNEFLAENVDQTKKNIKVFAEVATCQYMSEVSSMLSPYFTSEEESVQEGTEEIKEDPYF